MLMEDNEKRKIRATIAACSRLQICSVYVQSASQLQYIRLFSTWARCRCRRAFLSLMTVITHLKIDLSGLVSSALGVQQHHERLSTLYNPKRRSLLTLRFKNYHWNKVWCVRYESFMTDSVHLSVGWGVHIDMHVSVGCGGGERETEADICVGRDRHGEKDPTVAPEPRRGLKGERGGR